MVLGGWLDLMVLKALSNLNDSMKMSVCYCVSIKINRDVYAYMHM